MMVKALLIGAMSAISALAASASALQRAKVTVFPDREIGPVNRRVFGNNILAYQGRGEEYSDRGAGVWDPERHRPVPEFVELAKLSGMSVARWPGGCGTHRYNWKRTVGPLEGRQKFGLPEFLAFCEAVGAEPLITIAVYWGTARDAADLVEYLNAPVGKNPNGGKDWAEVRARDGHPEPYGVVWFEYGNESYHGDHKGHKISAEEYARRYLEYRRAMKAVDPNIKLGAIIQHGLDVWNRTVLRIAGKEIDFAIEHTYLPNYYGNKGELPSRTIAEACVACDAQLQKIYDDLNRLIYEETGRHIPIAVTEYNGHFVQERPVPYRQCLANALRNAEHIRIMLNPKNNILMACFWQFSNEYWGMVRGYVHKGERLRKQANFYVLQLYNRHFGDVLVGSKVECGTFEFKGGANVKPRTGKPRPFRLFPQNLLPKGATWELRPCEGVRQHLEGDVVVAEFTGKDVNYYHPRIVLPAEPMTGYRVVGWIKTENLTGPQGAGFQVGDARGWTATKSCTVRGDVRGTTGWTKVVSDYVTLPDTEAVEILARRLGGKGPVSGRAYYRIEAVYKFQPENFGAVPYVSCIASTSRDGRKVYIMLVNKNLDGPTDVEIRIAGGRRKFSEGRAWSLTGRSYDSTNLGPEDEVWVEEVPVRKEGEVFLLRLPKHSLTAVEVW